MGFPQVAVSGVKGGPSLMSRKVSQDDKPCSICSALDRRASLA